MTEQLGYSSKSKSPQARSVPWGFIPNWIILNVEIKERNCLTFMLVIDKLIWIIVFGETTLVLLGRRTFSNQGGKEEKACG